MKASVRAEAPMDIPQPECFLAVVDSGGQNRAATAPYVSRSSMSRRVRTLERNLGSEPLHQIGGRVVFTEVGGASIGHTATILPGMLVGWLRPSPDNLEPVGPTR
ncbi:hypothetical protein GCM10010240_45040 [Streptomyces griseoviridis]|nr:hypothetical protein GCM10010240_45040 [Streptomyces griseoviridis]